MHPNSHATVCISKNIKQFQIYLFFLAKGWKDILVYLHFTQGSHRHHSLWRFGTLCNGEYRQSFDFVFLNFTLILWNLKELQCKTLLFKRIRKLNINWQIIYTLFAILMQWASYSCLIPHGCWMAKKYTVQVIVLTPLPNGNLQFHQNPRNLKRTAAYCVFFLKQIGKLNWIQLILCSCLIFYHVKMK